MDARKNDKNANVLVEVYDEVFYILYVEVFYITTTHTWKFYYELDLHD